MEDVSYAWHTFGAINIISTSGVFILLYFQLLDWEMNVLKEYVSYEGCRIDPAPFQLVERTSLYRVSMPSNQSYYYLLQNVLYIQLYLAGSFHILTFKSSPLLCHKHWPPGGHCCNERGKHFNISYAILMQWI